LPAVNNSVAYAGDVQRPALRVVSSVSSQESHQLLAMVEAEVGSLLELLPVAVLVTSHTGTVLRANPAAGVALGLSQQALIGKPIDELLRHNRQSARVRTLGHGDEILRLYVL
jgi:PAS domain-containing protein